MIIPGRRGQFSEVNHEAFSTSTPEMEYWVGFLMADGCVLDNDGTYVKYRLQLVLQAGDYAHVANFARFLGLSRKPLLAESSGTLPNGKKAHRQTCKLSVRSDRICEDLISHGVTPRKSATAKASDYMAQSSHFWRGVLDGDGSICMDKRNGSVCVEMLGSLSLMSQWCEFCCLLHPNRKRYPNGKLYIPKPVRGGPLYRVRVGGPISHVVLRKLYADAEPALDRKKALWASWEESGWVSRRGQHCVENPPV